MRPEVEHFDRLEGSPLNTRAAEEERKLDELKREELLKEKAKRFLRRKKVYDPHESIKKALDVNMPVMDGSEATTKLRLLLSQYRNV